MFKQCRVDFVSCPDLVICFLMIGPCPHMAGSSSEPSRRDFLTGRAVQQKLRGVGDDIADAVLESGENRPAPVSRETIRLETQAMACSWCVVMNPGPPRQVMVASDALDTVHGCESRLTVYRDESEIARINREAAAAPQRLDPELSSFLRDCRSLWDATQGAFDPAAGALIRVWRDARRAGRIPDPAEIGEALHCSGMGRVVLDQDASTIEFTSGGVQLDFGAIGKGYAIDRAAEHLHGEEIEDFLIHGGYSSLYASGRHAELEGWPVGIRNPLFTEQRYATILLRQQGMSTSGSNVQYFRYQGRRYGHILDPRSGQPAEGLLSVTVLAESATHADALSTAFYVMGLDNALRYCDDHAEVGAILIPVPARGRLLEPIVRNIPEDRLFFEPSGEVPSDRREGQR